MQTILDDGYTPLSTYADELKRGSPEKWQIFVGKVGGEANALLFDSRTYFTDAQIKKEERCLNYARNLFAFLEVFNPELACIGLTDHNYFDEELIDTLVGYSQRAGCKAIPGVEINCGGIHMLLFFSKKPCKQPTFSEGIRTLIQGLGVQTQKDESGVLTISTKDVLEVLDKVFDTEEGIVVFPHCNNNNGLFQERGRTDRSFLAKIFNHRPVTLLQSQSQRSAIDVTEHIKKCPNLSAKFSTHISSDSRALRDIGRADPDGNVLWIKADPTFQGLKQILYEPERIFVGPEKPGRKKSYFLIDSVRFLDNTENIKFSSEPIAINPNLTTIIGGKSTGKSLLLHYIAKTVDSKEVENRRRETEPGGVSYDLDRVPNFNFEVTWSDGEKSLLHTTEPADGNARMERKLLYIPQRYLNTLSEANFRSRDALNQFVLKVMLQDPVLNEQYNATHREIQAARKSIPSEVADLFLQQEEIKKAEEELKQIGDEKGVRNYIKPLQQQIDEIKTKSGFTEDESKKYELLTTSDKAIMTQLSQLAEDKRTLANLDSTFATHLTELRHVADEYQDYFNDAEIKKKYADEIKVIDSFAPALLVAASNVSSSIDAKVQRLNEQMLKINADLAPLLAKVKLQSELREKSDAIKKEEQKLNDISIRTNALKTKKDAYQKKSEAILETYRRIASKYSTLQTEFKKFENRFGELALTILVGFKDELFNSEVVKEYLNRQDIRRTFSEADWGEEFVYQYDSTKHLKNITALFEGLLSGSIKTVKARPAKDAATKLFEDYFYLDFRIFYRNDSFDKMSPGKKGLVLLQLLINLSNEEWPILLDQPEDDLDNRSVYEDLVTFLKNKKTQRQIIIVTHNPNLVVGADAEETIVANQAGQEISRDNEKFRFEYVSGSLENSFRKSASEERAILQREGIRQHVCEILEGGREAFQKREQKYDFSDPGRL